MSSALKRLTALVPAGVRAGSATSGKHAEAHANMWVNISLFGALPAVAIASYIVYQHEKHHDEPPPEFIPYEHLRIRKKNFPWGDGKKSFFHNPERNALPNGYEVEHKH